MFILSSNRLDNRDMHLTRSLRVVLFILILTVFALCPAKTSFSAHASDHFPLYPVIRNNVGFWVKVYSDYSVNTAILHDKDDLSIIYTTISLKDPVDAEAAKSNDKKIKAAKQKYRKILTELANGKAARTKDARRVASLFGPGTSKTRFRKCLDNMRVQTGLKERFLEGVITSGAYMAELKTIFRTYNLPEDLAYLPHVESSFNLKAYSKYGAAGIWQFTRSTGQQYMTINNVIDERRDPILAAHAAAKFLRDNFDELQDWALALTAYNYGKAGMMRAKKAHGNYETIFSSYDEGYFKFASRNFYSEFLAAVYVAKKLENNPKIKLAKPASTIAVRMPAYAVTADFMKYLNLSEQDIKLHNPALLSTVFTGEKLIPRDYFLRLPAHKVRRQDLHNMPSSLFSPDQKKDETYIVKRGDSALKIALTFKVSLQQLIALNHLDKQARVYIGQTLKLPHSPASSKLSPTRSSALPKIKATENKRFRNVTATLSPSRPPARLNVNNIHSKKGITYGEIITQQGENFELIAAWLNLSESMLLAMNGFDDNQKFVAGKKILVRFSAISRNEFETRRKRFHNLITRR